MRRSLTLLMLVAACAGQSGPTTTTVDPTTTTTRVATTTTAGATTTSAGPSSSTSAALQPLQGLAYEEIAVLDFPIQMTSYPGSDLSYVATKDGRVWVFDGSDVSLQPALDISGAVRNQGEQGLLSIVIEPGGARLWAHYSANDGDTVVSAFAMTSPTEVDPGSEVVLLRLDQPAPNHNGGMLFLAEDGNLYLGLGDGGGANDQFGNGQNRDTLLGGIVRIPTDGESEPTLFQYGLRNPWRFWVDESLIYVADVGQNAFEEVSVAEFTPDINYGWPITEGLHCFRPSEGCDTSGLTLPVAEVSHGDAGTCSITGGIVYRGEAIPEVDGHFFYSDLCGGYLRSFGFDAGSVVDPTDWTPGAGVPGRVVSFGIDGSGEMYVMTTERLLKVVPVRG